MRKRALVILGIVLLVAGIAAACSDTGDLEERIEALEHQTSQSGELAALHEQVLRANMVATLNLLDDVGFHTINETILESGDAPAGTNGLIRTALRAVAVTTWPEELNPAAQDFQQKLQAFFDALRSDELSGFPGTAQAAHDTYHEFTGDAWLFLAESAGLTDGPGDGEDDDHDMQ
jgi:hypothetical protein